MYDKLHFMESDGIVEFDEHAISSTPRILTLVLLCVFVVGMSAGAVLSGGDLGLFTSSDSEFMANVDNDVGTNYFVLTEIDEGDNDEEVMVEHVLHTFVFEAKNRGGLITWDFGDGFTATGANTNHSYAAPGVYIVQASEALASKVSIVMLSITVNLESEAEVDNMECVCAPTAKDTVIPLSEHQGLSSLEGYVKVEHDGSSESCSLRNPLQECHVRVILQKLSNGDVVEESILFDDTFRSNEQVIDFVFDDVSLDAGERLQLRLETDQIRDWHKPTAAWLTSAPVIA